MRQWQAVQGQHGRCRQRRIRMVKRALVLRRMMPEVPRTDTAITNPSHVAFAPNDHRLTMFSSVLVDKDDANVAQCSRDLAWVHAACN
jgi:flagellar biosynthesis protein FlhB